MDKWAKKRKGHETALSIPDSVIALTLRLIGVPWGVQLAATYSLFDLASSNPEGIVEAIHAWRATVLNNIPFAVTNGITEVTSLCKMMLN
ncbi:hypothetical protein Q9966_004863 [Columba livia]|nr:hypothetical protein Q9966_004863 [Columba livia]